MLHGKRRRLAGRWQWPCRSVRQHGRPWPGPGRGGLADDGDRDGVRAGIEPVRREPPTARWRRRSRRKELTVWLATSNTKRESRNEARTVRDGSRRGRRHKIRTINLHAERRTHGRGRSTLDRVEAVSGDGSAGSGAGRSGRVNREGGGHSSSFSAGPARRCRQRPGSWHRRFCSPSLISPASLPPGGSRPDEPRSSALPRCSSRCCTRGRC